MSKVDDIVFLQKINLLRAWIKACSEENADDKDEFQDLLDTFSYLYAENCALKNKVSEFDKKLTALGKFMGVQ